MLDEQQRSFAVRDEAPDRTKHLVGARRVEVGGRLVEHQAARAERQKRRERDALLRAAGERRDRRSHIREAGLGSRRRDALGHRLAWYRVILETERDLVVDLEHHELRLGILEHDADRRRERGQADAAGRFAIHADLAALPVGLDRVRDDAIEAERERALAAAARAQEQEPLAALPAEGEIADRGDPPPDVTEGEPRDLSECAGHTSRTRSRPRA